MSSEHFITRQEIAALAEVSIYAVRRNEKNWGIDLFRRSLNTRRVRYLRQPTLGALAERGLLDGCLAPPAE